MFNLNKIKTPHGNPLAHFGKMLAFFVLGAAVVLLTDLGAASSGSLIAQASTIVAIGSVTLIGGIFGTMVLRTAFGLVQTGRILQYASFAAAASVTLLAFAWLVPAIVAVTSPILAGFLLLAIAFAPATLTGTVPLKGRTWLPVRRKNKSGSTNP